MKWPSLRWKSGKDAQNGDSSSGQSPQKIPSKSSFWSDTQSTTSGSSINSLPSDFNEDHVDPRCRPSVQRLLNKRIYGSNLIQPSDMDAAGLTPIMEDDSPRHPSPEFEANDGGIQVEGPEASHNKGCALWFPLCSFADSCEAKT
eukprot:gnl/MRDRNA2_/MRDRNA2_108847_c0_seq1.p1 gnl/MRDRNA2_/MRDRNA2_108847_c0~~gnl/MRDRNA2_/MRDRNA2_108847_c0_seq1.p1  ORF type:complete len:145 (-),score=16.94 gnl/MRDRNA2_/MRDRNA2_108847_c0_seq1:126-560(-)